MELRVRELCKRYGEAAALRPVSFTAGEGITCVSAPSGGGKTTLLRILMGLERADNGTVEGLDTLRVAAVFQENRLLEGRSAEANLRFALGAAYDAPSARALLAELGLELSDGKPVREYSGGMKRRLALARALLAPGELLLLDEPFTGLDEENRERAAACIRRCAAGRIVLLVTHELPDSLRGCRTVRL